MKSLSVFFIVLLASILLGCQSPVAPNQTEVVEKQHFSITHGWATMGEYLITVHYDKQPQMTIPWHVSYEPEIMAEDGDSVMYLGFHFVNPSPDPVYPEGYFAETWKYNVKEKKGVKMFSGRGLSDVAFFLANKKMMVFQDRPTWRNVVVANDVILIDLVSMSKTVVVPTWDRDLNQGHDIGGFKFSPSGDQVVMAVTFGYANLTGAIYILDIPTKKFTLVKQTIGPPRILEWGVYQ